MPKSFLHLKLYIQVQYLKSTIALRGANLLLTLSPSFPAQLPQGTLSFRGARFECHDSQSELGLGHWSQLKPASVGVHLTSQNHSEPSQLLQDGF